MAHTYIDRLRLKLLTPKGSRDHEASNVSKTSCTYLSYGRSSANHMTAEAQKRKVWHSTIDECRSEAL